MEIIEYRFQKLEVIIYNLLTVVSLYCVTVMCTREEESECSKDYTSLYNQGLHAYFDKSITKWEPYKNLVHLHQVFLGQTFQGFSRTKTVKDLN